MKTLIVLGVILALVLAYVLKGRAWLKSKPWMASFFARIEPYEILLFKKSETILWARLKMVSGVLLMAMTQLGAIDLTPLMPLVPDAWEPLVRVAFNLLPLALTVVGMVDEKLRNAVTKPIEIVAVPEKDMPVEVAVAMEKADAATEKAVVAVAVAKAEGAV